VSPILERKWLGILDNYLLNAVDVYDAAGQQTELPAFRLRSGLTLHHAPGFDVWSEFVEVFVRRYYTQPCFYAASHTDTVIDIGAGLGAFAIHLSALAPGVRVICVEPCDATAELLRYNIEANQLRNVVIMSPAPTRLEELIATGDVHTAALARVIADDTDILNLTGESPGTWRHVRSLVARCRTSDDVDFWAGAMRRLVLRGFRKVDVTRHDGGAAAILTASRPGN
jgi:FkbM family methyltransferase